MSKVSGLLFWLCFLFAVSVSGQRLEISNCYERARVNFPLIKQKELLLKSRDFSIANARTGYLPQFSIIGQATYQSDVTKVPLEVPGFNIKTLPKDQYKIYAEMNQSLYDGGAVRQQSAIQETMAMVEDQKLEVELYRIKERINQIFFGILLVDEQLLQTELLRKDIQSGLQRTEAAIDNGTAFKTSADILKAELLRSEQRTIELSVSRKAYLDMLGLFINEALPESTILVKPAVKDISVSMEIKRPEITLYQYQTQLYTAQQQLNNTRVLPRVGLFVQGGYGRPGLNMLNSDFATYYIGGLRLSWNLSGFYNTNRDKEQLTLNVQGVDYQKEAFVFNTKLTLLQQQNDIQKLQQLIRVDDQIIDLRTRIKETAKAQLENGVITANDFLRELNAEDQAKQNRSLHEIQFLMTQFNYSVTSGQ